MTDILTREMFAGCLNNRFQVIDEPVDPFDLELTEVSEKRESHGQENFSLLFRGPAGRFMAQSIHRLVHERLGEFDLFLVPVGRDETGFRYEAIFNRLI